MEQGARSKEEREPNEKTLTDPNLKPRLGNITEQLRNTFQKLLQTNHKHGAESNPKKIRGGGGTNKKHANEFCDSGSSKSSKMDPNNSQSTDIGACLCNSKKHN